MRWRDAVVGATKLKAAPRGSELVVHSPGLQNREPGFESRLPRSLIGRLLGVTCSLMARASRAPIGRRLGVGAALALSTLAASVTLAAAPGTTAALASCPHANAHPHQTSLANLRKAVRCLVNQKRAKHNRLQLKDNRRLDTAAGRHTKVMLRKDCFSHHCPGESGLNKRVKQSGYTKGASSYFFAEDLGFDRTPKRMIERLMSSKYNRHNILGKDFCDMGVGAGWGAPKKSRDDSKYATYTILFAWRDQRC
jgi:uncharacterized protein YkwD